MNTKTKPTITQLRPPPLPEVQTAHFKCGFFIGLLIGWGVMASLPYVVQVLR